MLRMSCRLPADGLAADEFKYNVREDARQTSEWAWVRSFKTMDTQRLRLQTWHSGRLHPAHRNTSAGLSRPSLCTALTSPTSSSKSSGSHSRDDRAACCVAASTSAPGAGAVWCALGLSPLRLWLATGGSGASTTTSRVAQGRRRRRRPLPRAATVKHPLGWSGLKSGHAVQVGQGCVRCLRGAGLRFVHASAGSAPKRSAKTAWRPPDRWLLHVPLSILQLLLRKKATQRFPRRGANQPRDANGVINSQSLHVRATSVHTIVCKHVSHFSALHRRQACALVVYACRAALQACALTAPEHYTVGRDQLAWSRNQQTEYLVQHGKLRLPQTRMTVCQFPADKPEEMRPWPRASNPRHRAKHG